MSQRHPTESLIIMNWSKSRHQNPKRSSILLLELVWFRLENRLNSQSCCITIESLLHWAIILHVIYTACWTCKSSIPFFCFYPPFQWCGSSSEGRYLMFSNLRLRFLCFVLFLSHWSSIRRAVYSSLLYNFKCTYSIILWAGADVVAF